MDWRGSIYFVVFVFSKIICIEANKNVFSKSMIRICNRCMGYNHQNNIKSLSLEDRATYGFEPTMAILDQFGTSLCLFLSSKGHPPHPPFLLNHSCVPIAVLSKHLQQRERSSSHPRKQRWRTLRGLKPLHSVRSKRPLWWTRGMWWSSMQLTLP